MHCLEDGEAVHPQNIFRNNRHESKTFYMVHFIHFDSLHEQKLLAHGSKSVRDLAHECSFEERIAFILVF